MGIFKKWYIKTPLFFITCLILCVKLREDDLSWYTGLNSIPRQSLGFLLRNHGGSLLNTVSYTLNFLCIPVLNKYIGNVLSGNARVINNNHTP